MAVSYDQIYKEEFNKAIGDSVTRLQQSQEQQEKALKAGYDQQQTALADNRNKALREAYISKMKEERDMPSAMARQGLNGGMVESNVASINRAYQNNRRAAEDNYANNKTTLDVGYEGDLANIRSQYVDAIATARQNANSLALSAAQQKYNNLLAEEEKAKAEAEAKKAAEEAAAQKKAEEEAAAAEAARQAAAASGSGTKSGSQPNANPQPKPPEVDTTKALYNQSGLAGTSGGTSSSKAKTYDKTVVKTEYQPSAIAGKQYRVFYYKDGTTRKVLIDKK